MKICITQCAVHLNSVAGAIRANNSATKKKKHFECYMSVKEFPFKQFISILPYALIWVNLFANK